MNDFTEGVAEVYRSLRQVFEDLNRLGQDFGQALRDEKLDLTEVQEYSHSPNTLVLKTNHCWFYSRPFEEAARSSDSLTFAACLVYFEADRGRWKCSEPGRPELWFFMGRVSPPPKIKWASTLRTLFDKGDERHYDVKPTLGGITSCYRYDATEKWTVVCLGYELGNIDSVAALKEKAVQPLVAAAAKFDLVT
jgi:hypothetical protein